MTGYSRIGDTRPHLFEGAEWHGLQRQSSVFLVLQSDSGSREDRTAHLFMGSVLLEAPLPATTRRDSAVSRPKRNALRRDWRPWVAKSRLRLRPPAESPPDLFFTAAGCREGAAGDALSGPASTAGSARSQALIAPSPPIPLVDVAWLQHPWAGHDLDTTLRRLDDAAHRNGGSEQPGHESSLSD